MSMTATKATNKEAAEEPKRGGLLKKIGIGLVALLLVGGATWWFVLKPGPPEKPKPGAVATLDSIQINLAGGHYLRLGMALQLTEKTEEVNGSKALDAAIDMFSGRDMNALSQQVRREQLKEQLSGELHELYEGEVLDVYFTEFVTQ